MAMRIIVCGSRQAQVHPYDILKILDLYKPEELGITWVHGGSGGADMAAHDLALDLMTEEDENCYGGPPPEEHPARWDLHGKAAGPIRNKQMAEAGADLCLAFWDGRSKGTSNMIVLAVRHGIPVRVVPLDKEGNIIRADHWW